MNVDLDLVTACINKERKAEFELYKITYSYLMSICIRYTKNQDKAKEVLNIGFTKALFNLDKYRPEIPFKKWIRKVMINTLIDEFRKEVNVQKNIDFVENYKDYQFENDNNEVLAKMNADQIHTLICQLPPVSQKVFNLSVIDGYNHKEIGDLLNITESTSRWHLNFSRNRLKEMLQKLASAIKINV